MAGYFRAVLGALCLVVALAAPASADADGWPEPLPRGPILEPVGPESAWLPARCATGAITGVEEERYGPPALWVTGWIQPCDAPGFVNAFTVFWYYGPVAMRSRYLREYYSVSDPTPFAVKIATPGGPEPTLGLTALCVAYDYDGRLACMAIDADTPGVLPVVTPIPNDDPRVLHPVPRPRPGGEETWPVCGTCL